MHVHPGASISGVLYVSAPEQAGRLIFTDPRGNLPPFEEKVVFHPAEGDLILFPPWLAHEVGSSCATADSAGPRLSISFNYANYDALENGVWGQATAMYHKVIDSSASANSSSTCSGDGVAADGKSGAAGSIAVDATGTQVAPTATDKAQGLVSGMAAASAIASAAGLVPELEWMRDELARLRGNLDAYAMQSQQQRGREAAAHHMYSPRQRSKRRGKILGSEGARAQKALEAILTESAKLLEEMVGASIKIEIDE